MLGSDKRVGPFMGVTDDSIKTLADGRKFRVLLYGAYNAFGLIGPEFNGIAVLNEDAKNVVADNLGQIQTGYFGPSQEQKALFERVMKMTDDEFIQMVNESPRRRYAI
jgi:hypothetical protein